MVWPRRSPAADQAAGEGGGDESGRESSSGAHDSPALAEIFAGLDEDRPIRVLDLGPALRANLEFYSEFACSVRIAHLLRGDDVEAIRQLEPDPFVSILERLSPADEEPFELILLWDLFNYLVEKQPSILAHHLAAVAGRGARIHAMTFTTDTMPAEPSRYEILGGGRLSYRPTSNRRIAAPDPPPALVERWLNPFRVERSFLLRHGVREFIAHHG